MTTMDMQAATRFIANISSARRELLDKLNGRTSARDLYEQCGYTSNPSPIDFLDMYHRELGSRVVNIVPDEAWKMGCEIRETEDAELTDFEKTWEKLQKRHNLWHFLQRADEVSGIGCYGVMLLGLDDGKPLNQPVDAVLNYNTEEPTPPTGKPLKLLYVRVFNEAQADIATFDDDPNSPRYGMPLMYDLTFSNMSTTGKGGGQGGTGDSTKMNVHWTRVVHIADNRKTSEVFGIPRQLPVWNRLWDIRKVAGSSGEMYYQGALPGISLETHPSNIGAEVEIDEEATRDQVQQYVNTLRRFLILDGMSAKSLAPNVVSPDAFITSHIQLVCAVLKIPYRVFIGSEAAAMASTQDLETWYGRMNGRNEQYTGPLLVRPFIERLISVGVLPFPNGADGSEAGGFDIVFPDLNKPKEADVIANAQKMTEALAKYVQAGVEAIMPLKEFLTMVFDFDSEQADAIVEASEERVAQLEEEQLAIEKELMAEQARLNPPMPPKVGPDGVPMPPKPLPKPNVPKPVTGKK